MSTDAVCPPQSDKPMITVISAVFNGASTLQRCIDSVAGQTYPHKEHLLKDGGSTDGSVDLLEKNAGRIGGWWTGPDRGMYDAWNHALPHATGDWICFLGSDDFFWQADVLERMVEHLRRVPPEIRVVYGKVCLLDEGGDIWSIWGSPWPDVRSKFLKGIMRAPHPGMCHRRSLFEELGHFDPSFRLAGDYEMLLRELKNADALHLPDLIVAGMNLGGSTHRTAQRFHVLAETLRARRKNGVGGLTLPLAAAYVKNGLLLALEKTLGARGLERLRSMSRPAKVELGDGDCPAW